MRSFGTYKILNVFSAKHLYMTFIILILLLEREEKEVFNGNVWKVMVQIPSLNQIKKKG